MGTWHIHIYGQVQGVGFRPAVYRIANRMGLSGCVSNETDGVHVLVNGSEEAAESLRSAILRNAPPRSIITGCAISRTKDGEFTGFTIRHSGGNGPARLLITPDMGICEDCARELTEPEDRRFGYPFITCIHCGPRYSILNALPYDRERTTMLPFGMCPDCRREYEDPGDRRYFSQTNSCPQCPVDIFFLDGDTPSDHRSTGLLEAAVGSLTRGDILAVKGIGGFLLMADATNPDAVRELRKRKDRPGKPFALLYPDTDALDKDADINEAERKAFLSIESPIVLVRLRDKPASGIASDAIAPGLDRIGAMQPYAPLLLLLSRQFGRPLIATSGNVSGSPIVFRDEEAGALLSPIADRILSNTRDITSSQDDSVLTFSETNGIPVFLRRSRGYSPTYLPPSRWDIAASGLAMGAQLKSTLALSHQGNVYVSQYLGNLEHFDCCRRMSSTYEYLRSLLRFRPDWVAVDRHPDYFASREGRSLAEQKGIPLIEVQHHKAHAAAVLAEHDLLDAEEPVLCVVWDGTGYGDDGQVWGSEFFLYRDGAFGRIAHLPYFPHLAGDKMSREPRISALSICSENGQPPDWMRSRFRPLEWDLYGAQLEGNPGLQSSSMGRMFDAVASIAGLCQVMTFEGEAAMYLERTGRKYLRKHGLRAIDPWPVDPARLLTAAREGMDPGELALRFHLSLANWIREVAEETGIHKLAFSGGVWQNCLLVDLVYSMMSERYDLYFHKKLSPNDESVSFGQLVTGLFLQDN